jgi:hypothetical protein
VVLPDESSIFCPGDAGWLRAQADCEATKSCNAGVYFDELVCHLNDKVNRSTFEDFKWEIQGLWQPYCAINRGIFVLQPGNSGWKNHTYSCGALPTDWGMDNIGDLVNAEVDVALHALDGTQPPSPLHPICLRRPGGVGRLGRSDASTAAGVCVGMTLGLPPQPTSRLCSTPLIRSSATPATSTDWLPSHATTRACHRAAATPQQHLSPVRPGGGAELSGWCLAPLCSGPGSLNISRHDPWKYTPWAHKLRTVCCLPFAFGGLSGIARPSARSAWKEGGRGKGGGTTLDR